MPLETKQTDYIILVNADGFVKLTSVAYAPSYGPPYAYSVAIKPRACFYSADPVEFRRTQQISADEAQRRFGLLIRANHVHLYEEL